MTCICGKEISFARAMLGYTTCLDCGEADAELERVAKSERTALSYNKGPYQYITPGTDLRKMGKKN